MKLKSKSKKKNGKHEDNASEEIPVEILLGHLGLKRRGAPEGYVDVETYPLEPPFSYASIVQNEATAEL
ncbi:MAG: hypothetical protein PVF15_02955, partial [Candidatus Bathyarchaeota archaeon]